MEPTAVSISVQPATSPKIAIQRAGTPARPSAADVDHRQPGHLGVNHGGLRKPQKARQGQRERDRHRDPGKSS